MLNFKLLLLLFPLRLVEFHFFISFLTAFQGFIRQFIIIIIILTAVAVALVADDKQHP
jgi:hypothetical protein